MEPTDTPPPAATDRPWLARFTRVAAMVIFTAMIAVISYLDGLFLIRYAGDRDWSAYLYPLIPDGLILICSVRLHEAAPKIPAWAMGGVIIGVTLTLAMNVGAGVLHNWMYALADACVPVVFFVALEVVRGAVRRGPGETATPLARAALNQGEPGEPPTRESVLLGLIGTGTRQEIADFLGVPKSRVQRWATDLPRAVQAVPPDSAGHDWDGAAEAELEPSVNGSGPHA